MNERIRELAHEAGLPTYNPEGIPTKLEKFAELIVQDYAKKAVQGWMSDPAFVQAMDEYYEKKWAHRFD